MIWTVEMDQGDRVWASAQLPDLCLELELAGTAPERAYCPACLDTHAGTCPELTTTGMA